MSLNVLDTDEMRAERESFVALDLMRCASCGRVFFVRRGKEPEICPCGGELLLSAEVKHGATLS